jgi:hypothetical protein
MKQTSLCVVDVSKEDQDKSTSTVHSKQSVGKSNLSLSTIKTILELLSDEAVSECMHDNIFPFGYSFIILGLGCI